jgi:hypothetical protein
VKTLLEKRIVFPRKEERVSPNNDHTFPREERILSLKD